MKEKIEIRPMKVEDAEPIVDVLEKTWRSTYSHILTDKILKKKEKERAKRIENWKTAPNTKDAFVFVATVNEKVVGVVDCYIESDDEKYLGYGEIGNIYVLKECQHMSIGSKLFATAMKKLKDEGIERFVLTVFKNNSAREFYQKQGGVLSETRDYMWDDWPCTDEYYTFDLTKIKQL